MRRQMIEASAMYPPPYASCWVLGVLQTKGALQQVQLIEPESDQLFRDSLSFKLLVSDVIFLF